MLILIVLILSFLSYFFCDRLFADYCVVSPWFFSLSHHISSLLDPFFLLLISLMLIALCSTIKKYKPFIVKALLSFSTITASMFIVGNLKMLARRPRPYVYLEDGSYGFFMGDISSSFLSFPSSHAAVTVALATLWIDWFPSHKRGIYSIVPLLLFLRVILQEHFISDILMGSLIGYLVSKGILKIKKLLETRSFIHLKQK